LEVVNGRIQTFVTSTGLQDIVDKISSKSRIFEVKNGKISIIQEG